MTNETLSQVVIKDAQQLETLHWEDYNLFIKIASDEIQMGVYRPDTRYFIRMMAFSFASDTEGGLKELFDQLLSEQKIKPERCKKVTCIIDTPLYTVVPEEIYDDKLKKEYFDFLYLEKESCQLQTDQINAGGLRVIYPVAADILTEIAKYPGFSVCHHQTVLLKNVKEKEGEVIYVTLHDRYCSLVVYSGGRLLLAQSYKAEKSADVVYYILNAVRHLDLSGNVRLFFTGKREDAAAILQKLEGRLKSIAWLERPEGCQYPAGITEYPSHYFYHLVSLALCGSSAENLEAEG